MEQTAIEQLAIEQEWEVYVRNHMEESEASARAVRKYLENSTVAYRGRCVQTLHIPKIYSARAEKDFQYVVKTMYGIFQKMIHAYREHEEFRRLFPFSRELEEMILLPQGYETEIPICRIDIFYNEETGDFKFCEFNTDGTSAMNEDLELNRALEYNNAYQKLKQKYQFYSRELFDSWVDAFMENYRQYQNAVEKPYIAIVDFLDHAYVKEFEVFASRFLKRGYEIEICEIRDLRMKEGRLFSPKGHPIDAIYRRAVTCDILERAAEIPDFLEAVRTRCVCLQGDIQTQIAHHKFLFAILHQPEAQAFLNEEEIVFVKQHLPKTWLLKKGAADFEQVLGEKDRWIIKPLDSYGSQGVYAGVDYDAHRWQEIVETCQKESYLVQEYCTPYQTPDVYLHRHEMKWDSYSNMAGLFTYNGKLAGVYSRLSDGGIISSQYNEKAVASVFLTEQQPNV